MLNNLPNSVSYTIIIFIGIILYFNTFNNSFVWDDEYLIEKDIRIRSWGDLPEIFISSLSLPSPKQGNFYRPFQVISFLFDYSFWKLNPFGYHITNLSFHILNGLLIYILVKMLLEINPSLPPFNKGGDRGDFKKDIVPIRTKDASSRQTCLIPLLAALLFLIHPVHIEAVTYISGRADTMVTFFCLVSLILFLRYRNFKVERDRFTQPVPSEIASLSLAMTSEESTMTTTSGVIARSVATWQSNLIYNTSKEWLLYAGSIVSFLCALLSKEAALVFPFLLVWFGYSFSTDLKGQSHSTTSLRSSVNGTVPYYLPFFLLSALYVALRLTLLKTISEPHPPIAPFYSRAITFFNVIIRYTGLLFFPQNLHMERRIPFLNSLFQWEAVVSIVLVGILILATIWLRKYSKEAGFGLGWFLIALLPVSNIMPINAAMAEHWLYMPSIGFFLAVATGISKLPPHLNPPPLLGEGIGGGGKAGVAFMTPDFRVGLIRPLQVLRYIFILLLAASFIFYSIQTIRQNLVWNDEISLYNSILKYTPDSARIHINLGVAYAKRDEYDKAITEYKKAIELYPDFVMTYINMGYMYGKKELDEEAVKAYKAALAIRPYVAEYIPEELRLIYSSEEVSEMPSRQYTGNPLSNLELADLYNNVALIYDKEDRFSDAVRMYKKAIETNPEYTDARINLGILYRKKGIYDNAIKEFNELLKIDKGSIDGHFNLGFIYDRLGRYEEALSEYKEVVRIKPRDVKAHNNLGTAYGKLGMHLEAISEYKRALSIDPDFGMSHFNLGSAYANKGEMGKAVEEWERALQLDPGLEEARINIIKSKEPKESGVQESKNSR